MPDATRTAGYPSVRPGGGLLITILKLTEYRFLVVEHSLEMYGGLIAATVLGARNLAGTNPDPKEDTTASGTAFIIDEQRK